MNEAFYDTSHIPHWAFYCESFYDTFISPCAPSFFKTPHVLLCHQKLIVTLLW